MLDLDNTGAGAQALALRFYQNVGIAAPSFLPSCPPAVRSYSERPRNRCMNLDGFGPSHPLGCTSTLSGERPRWTNSYTMVAFYKAMFFL